MADEGVSGGRLMGGSPRSRLAKKQAQEEWAGYDPEKAGGSVFVGDKMVHSRPSAYSDPAASLAHTPPPPPTKQYKTGPIMQSRAMKNGGRDSPLAKRMEAREAARSALPRTMDD